MGNTSSKRSEQLITTPTGLYDHCEWDPKVVRRLILEKKLAPFSVGKEETSEEGLEECPICFLYYSGGLNRSRCCRKGACTECYLQVKRPNQSTTCPFCNHAQYIVTFSGPLSREEIAQEAQEQQKVQELKTIMRNEEIERDKQRMLEKERLRKEQEQSGTTLGNSVPTPPRHSNENPQTPHSVPSNTQPPFGTFGQYYGSTYPPLGNTQHSFVGDTALAEADLDDLMLMEAIRLSLLDVQPPSENPPTTISNPPLSHESSESDDAYNSDDSTEMPNPPVITTNTSNITSTTPITDITMTSTMTDTVPEPTSTTNVHDSPDTQDLVDYGFQCSQAPQNMPHAQGSQDTSDMNSVISTTHPTNPIRELDPTDNLPNNPTSTALTNTKSSDCIDLRSLDFAEPIDSRDTYTHPEPITAIPITTATARDNDVDNNTNTAATPEATTINEKDDLRESSNTNDNTNTAHNTDDPTFNIAAQEDNPTTPISAMPDPSINPGNLSNEETHPTTSFHLQTLGI